MPLDKKSLSFLHYLQTAYASDEESIQTLIHSLPSWTKQYKKIYQSLFTAFKREKTHSKSLKSVLLDISDALRLPLSEQLTENDLLKILTEACILSSILKNKVWQELVEDAHLGFLEVAIQQLKIRETEDPAFAALQQMNHEITTHFPHEMQKAIWQHVHHSQQQYATQPVFPQKAVVRLISYSNYLLKRKLGLSLNDEKTQILCLNAVENNWENNLLSVIEPDVQANAAAKRIMSCKLDLMDFGLGYAHARPSKPDLLVVPMYWQDPLNTLEKGLQTHLFSSVNEEDTLSLKLQHAAFSLISLDMRQPLHPYRYAHKSIQGIDQQLLSAFQNLKVQDIPIGQRERMLYWSLEKLGTQGILLVILPRTILEDKESQAFRQFLAQSFYEIYILDLEDLAVLYLVKKSVSGKVPQDHIQYTRLAVKELTDDNNIDFESLKWQKVQADRQNYWIALPPSDFFDLYPVFGGKQAIFKSSVQGMESLMDEWLMDDDPKMLEKKVKYLLKQYAQLKKNKDQATSDIKWPEVLRKMAQSGLAWSFDKQKILKLQIKPFVYTFIYAEEKLLRQPATLVPSIAYDNHLKQVFPLNEPWHAQLLDQLFAFPLTNHDSLEKAEENISDKALAHFQTYYQLRTKNLDQTFIVFPPENISTTLDKIESVSRDLPVIRKYPNQINRLLEDARHFTSDVELLTPPYEKIDEFRRKVLRLEKDAIERRVIYQKVKAYIEELKEQLAALTGEHDDAQKDYEAVTKENIFYYTYAVLHDPNYRQKYHAFLERELPRLPMQAKFRQWVQWGKALFHAHQIHKEAEHVSFEIQVKEEQQEDIFTKNFAYAIDEKHGSIIIKEQRLQITLSNIPEAAWDYQFDGRSPMIHYLEYLSQKTIRDKKIKKLFAQQPLLADKIHIIAHLKHLCSMSIRLAALEKEMQKAYS